MCSNNGKRIFRGVYNPITKKFKMSVTVDFLWNEYQEIEFDIIETCKYYKFSVVISHSQMVDYFLYMSETPELSFQVLDYEYSPVLDKPFFMSFDLEDFKKEIAELKKFRKIDADDLCKDNAPESNTQDLLKKKSFENIGIDTLDENNSAFVCGVENHISDKSNYFCVKNGYYDFYFIRRGDTLSIFHDLLYTGNFLKFINPFVLGKFSTLGHQSIRTLQHVDDDALILKEIFSGKIVTIAEFLENGRNISDIFYNKNVRDVSFFSLKERDYYVVVIEENHRNL